MTVTEDFSPGTSEAERWYYCETCSHEAYSGPRPLCPIGHGLMTEATQSGDVRSVQSKVDSDVP